MATITVTATQGGAGASAGMLLRVKVLTDAALAGSPATGTKTGGGSSAAANAAVTTTQAGSQVYGALSFWHSADGSFTAEGNTTLFDNVTDSANGNLYGTCRTTSATVTPGSITVGASGPSDTGANAALLEVLASGGTVTEDGSSPASVSTTSAETVTTASFTPPPGSLLVAMAGTNGTSSAAVSMTVTDSSGLTWTARVEADAAFYGYAGVWTAQVPASPVSPAVTVLQQVPGSATAPSGIGTTAITTQEGSWLAVLAGWNTDTPGGVIPVPAVNVTDSAGNLWQQAAISTPGSAPTRCAAWVAPNALPVSWVSAGLTGYAASAAWTVAEIAGMPQAAAVDFCVSTGAAAGSAASLSWVASETGIGFAVAVIGNAPGSASTPSGWTNLGTAKAGTAATGCAVVGYLNGGISAGSATTSLSFGGAVPYSYALCSLSASASPPPQANLNFPGVTVEAAFGAQPGNIQASVDYLFSSEYTGWTDITKRVIGPAVQGRIKTKRGRPYQLQQQETGTAEIPLSNVDGAATPTNPGSPWYSNALNGNMSFQSSLAGWNAGSGGVSIAQSAAYAFASGLNAVAQYSMQVTPDAGNSGAFTANVPVNQNCPYSGSAWLLSPGGWSSGAHIQVNWFTSGGSYITTLTGPDVPLPAGQWTQAAYTGITPPSGAAYASLIVSLNGSPSSSNVYYAAEAALVTGPEAVQTGLVAPLTPVRVTAWWQGRRYPVWAGYAQQWPQEWPDMPQWGFSTLKAADALGAAAAGQMQSALIGEVLIDDPYAYLPCNESYTSQVNGATPTEPFIFSGGYLEPADANALPAVNRAADNQVTGTYVDGTGQQVSTGLAMNFLGDSGTGMGATGYGSAVAGYAGPAMLYTDPGLPAIFPGPASLEFWFSYSGTATQAVTLLNTYGAPSAFWTTAAGEGGILTVYANGSTLTTNTLSSTGLASAAITATGNPQHYALIVTDATPGFLMYVNGVLAGSAASPLTIGPVGAIALGPGRWSYDTNSSNASYFGYNYAAGHLAVYSYELSPARITAHYQAGANGWQGVSASTRFSQILTWAQLGLKRGGWSQAGVTGQAEITQIGPAYDLSGQQASDAIYNVAQSEGGRYKVQANGSLVYLERDAGYNLPVSATLADGTAPAPAALNTDPGFATGLAGWTGGGVSYSPGNRYGSLGALSAAGTVTSPAFSWNGGSASAGFWVQVPSGGTVTTFAAASGGTATAAAAVSPGAWSFLPLTVHAVSSVSSASLSVSAGTAPFYLAYAAMWYSSGQVRYLPKQSYGFDTTYIYNEVTATQQDGPNQLIIYDARGTASQAQYFRRSALSFTPDVISAYDVSDVTTWSLAGYQQPSLHVSAITVDAASNPLEAFGVVLPLDTGQVALTSRHPVGGAPLAETGTVEQIGHVIGPGYWQTSCQLSPYGPAQGVLCADTAGFDAAGTSLTISW